MCFVLLKYLDEELFRFSGGEGGTPPAARGGTPVPHGGTPFLHFGKIKINKKTIDLYLVH